MSPRVAHDHRWVPVSRDIHSAIDRTIWRCTVCDKRVHDPNEVRT